MIAPVPNGPETMFDPLLTLLLPSWMTWRPPRIVVPPLYVLSPLIRSRPTALELTPTAVDTLVMRTGEAALPSTSLVLTTNLSSALEMYSKFSLEPFRNAV